MENDYITIKQFAELAGVSPQSIYKKIRKPNNPIQPYIKTVEGVKYIRRAALDVLYNSPNIPKAEAKPEQSKNTADGMKRLLDILEEQLREARRQIDKKDEIIAAQTAQISNLLERVAEANQIINQQQQLAAINTKALSAAKEKETRPSILKRLFKGKNDE